MTLRIDGHSWRYGEDSNVPTQHRFGRGMWHTVDRCIHLLCGADSPRRPTPDEVDDFADQIKATIAELGNPLLQAGQVRVALPRVFSLIRTEDVSGVSGTGIVAQGVQFRDGQVVLQWCCPGLPSSVAVWPSLEDMLTIHGHRGRTVIKWADGRD